MNDQQWLALTAHGIFVVYPCTASLIVLQVPPPAPYEVDEEADSALGEDA